VLLAQSLPLLQARPVAQSRHEPPQSTSLSSPFLISSLQVAATQSFREQTWLAQSLASAQACPVSQPVQPPPQSASDSLPFFTPS
jgi:hypothetical protein